MTVCECCDRNNADLIIESTMTPLTARGERMLERLPSSECKRALCLHCLVAIGQANVVVNEEIREERGG